MNSNDPTLREVLSPIVRAIVAETKSDVLMISQLNVESILGISKRVHLENCRRADFTPRVVRAGKLRLVDATEYRTWLRALDAREVDLGAFNDGDGASGVLAELGLRDNSARAKVPSWARERRGSRSVKVR